MSKIKVISDFELRKLGMRGGLAQRVYPATRKTPDEKRRLKIAKLNHNKKLIKAGFSPKRRLNLSEPMTISSGL